MLIQSHKKIPRLKYNIATFIAAVVTSACILVSIASAAAPEEEATELFKRFIVARHAHDDVTVESILWNSSEFLWVSRGIQTRGRDAAMKLFRSYYSATWKVEPEMDSFHAVKLSTDVVQILVPIVFTRAEAGQPAQKARFLISQSLVHQSDGWHIASILPIADTSLKK
ncbi:MAG: DUF4440 domain-containing protein [Pseudomonas sp.]